MHAYRRRTTTTLGSREPATIGSRSRSRSRSYLALGAGSNESAQGVLVKELAAARIGATFNQYAEGP